MTRCDRREFMGRVLGATAALGLGSAAASPKGAGVRFGLVTYLWGKDMDLPTLIDSCERSGVLGVELRTEHPHAVEPTLSKKERDAVRRRFADSPVTLVGYGSNAQFHESDTAKVAHNIELTKRYIDLMADCGGSGVKIKPNNLPEGALREDTIERIGKAFNVVGKYGADHGQQIRVEIHGKGSSELPAMKAIMDVADHPNVTVCWNCNDQDTHGEGLEYNFNLVKNRFGDTVHIRELNIGDYPYAELMDLFVEIDYKGWILLEARTDPENKVKAMQKQRRIFEQMIGRD